MATRSGIQTLRIYGHLIQSKEHIEHIHRKWVPRPHYINLHLVCTRRLSGPKIKITITQSQWYANLVHGLFSFVRLVATYKIHEHTAVTLFKQIIILILTYLFLSVTEYTSKNPSPVLRYCSLIVLNSSWPAVSSTEKYRRLRSQKSQKHTYAIAPCPSDW